MDHMNFLGNNIKKIAYEKAGIIKNKCLVIMSSQKIVREVVRKETKNKKCILFEERNDWRITEIKKKHLF